MMKVVELTKENENEYLEQIAQLEQTVLQKMKKEGREGQLFITGKEDISEYVHSQENTVLVAVDDKKQVQAATYITQGQKPFTYNDITKYFKFGNKYNQYVKNQYDSVQEYQKDLLEIYTIKIQAFEYAKERVLNEYPEQHSIHTFIEQELQENGFHEKSELREKINQYMSEYIIENFGIEVQEKYERFYWITSEDISQEFGKEIKHLNNGSQEYERFIQAQTEYEEILQKGKLTIYEKPQFNECTYFTANTQNAVELDTYLTSPDSRSSGTARIIVFEGIKKHIERHFQDSENHEIFLCSTLHRDNLSSKYVSEFFGLTDSLYVNRRQGRDREVHICKILREQVMEYLAQISDKLAVLYGYNPDQKHISESTRIRVLKSQLEYEKTEYERLTRAKATDKKFSGINVKFISSKLQKIRHLQERIQQSDSNRGGETYGE